MGQFKTTRYIVITAFALFALLFAGCCEKPQATAPKAEAKKIYNWKLAMTWPTNFPIFSEAVNSVAEKVKTMSNGELVITIASANKHKAPLGILDMVNAGIGIECRSTNFGEAEVIGSIVGPSLRP